MNFHISRSDLLHKLESVVPGLSPTGIVEQTDNFVFKNGRLITFNHDVACRIISGFPKELEVAITAKPLMDLLSKLDDEDLEVALNEEYLVVRGKRNEEGGVRISNEIVLQLDAVERPKKWQKMNKRFTEAIGMVQECATKDATKTILSCVHIHPEFVEACDNYQIARYNLDTFVQEPILVKRDSIKKIISLDMTEFCETESWMHFKNPSGLILSCRRYVESYKDMTSYIEIKNGKPITLPRGLEEAVSKATIFSKENEDDDSVMINLRPGKVRIHGVGASGYYKRRFKIKYRGAPLEFMIAPNVISQIAKRHNECLIDGEKMKVEGGRWVYVTSLSNSDQKEEKEESDA